MEHLQVFNFNDHHYHHFCSSSFESLYEFSSEEDFSSFSFYFDFDFDLLLFFIFLEDLIFYFL